MPSDLTLLVETHVAWSMHHCHLPVSPTWRRPVPACALWLVLDGSAKVTSAEREWTVQSGEAFLCDCRLPRQIVIPQSAEWLTVGLVAPLLGRDLIQSIGLPILWQPGEEERRQLQFFMSELVRLHPSTDTAHLIEEGLTRALVGVVLKAHNILDFGAIKGGAPPWLANVLRFARENPGASVADLAREAHFSAAQFRRVFHEWADMSPHEFLQRERIERSRRLLENTNLPVDAIARQMGFSGASPFTRIFRQFSGLTPAAYRTSARSALKNQA